MTTLRKKLLQRRSKSIESSSKIRKKEKKNISRLKSMLVRDLERCGIIGEGRVAAAGRHARNIFTYVRGGSRTSLPRAGAINFHGRAT